MRALFHMLGLPYELRVLVEIGVLLSRGPWYMVPYMIGAVKTPQSEWHVGMTLCRIREDSTKAHDVFQVCCAADPGHLRTLTENSSRLP